MSQRRDDGQLLRLYAEESDESAFRELTARHASMLFQLCRRFGKNNHEAEDVTQQVFAILASKAHTLLDRENLSGWLRRTAWQISCRTLRATQIRRRHEVIAATVAANSAPEARLEPDVIPLVHQHLASLPEPYRTAISLYYFQGLTVSEVAQQVNCPPGTAAARISRGRDMLREKIDPALWSLIGACVVAEMTSSSECSAASLPAATQGGPPVACAAAAKIAAKSKWAAAILAFHALPMTPKAFAAAALTAIVVSGKVVKDPPQIEATATPYHYTPPNSGPRSESQSSSPRHYSPPVAVPEPSTTFLLGTLAAGTLLRRRRTV